jgi:hypothetical protein
MRRLPSVRYKTLILVGVAVFLVPYLLTNLIPPGPNLRILMAKPSYLQGEPIEMTVIIDNPLPNQLELVRSNLTRRDLLEFDVGNQNLLKMYPPRVKESCSGFHFGSKIDWYVRIPPYQSRSLIVYLQSYVVRPKPGAYQVTCKWDVPYDTFNQRTFGPVPDFLRQFLPEALRYESPTGITGSQKVSFTIEEPSPEALREVLEPYFQERPYVLHRSRADQFPDTCSQNALNALDDPVIFPTLDYLARNGSAVALRHLRHVRGD